MGDYGPQHRKTRRQLVAELRLVGWLQCWRCSGVILSEDDLHVGHDDWDRSITRGPEHVLCNLRAAAAKTNGTLYRPRSREW